MLRQATPADHSLVLEMCLKFSKQIELKDYVDARVLDNLVWDFLNTENRVVFLYGEVGMLAAFIEPFLLGTALAATELAWWVEPEYRKQNVGLHLVKAYEDWAQERGCKIISMACYANNSLGTFYEKCGYRLNELGYIKCLPH